MTAGESDIQNLKAHTERGKAVRNEEEHKSVQERNVIIVYFTEFCSGDIYIIIVI